MANKHVTSQRLTLALALACSGCATTGGNPYAGKSDAQMAEARSGNAVVSYTFDVVGGPSGKIPKKVLLQRQGPNVVYQINGGPVETVSCADLISGKGIPGRPDIISSSGGAITIKRPDGIIAVGGVGRYSEEAVTREAVERAALGLCK